MLPTSEVRWFKGAGHPIQVEQPKEYSEALTAFVFENTAASETGVHEEVRQHR